MKPAPVTADKGFLAEIRADQLGLLYAQSVQGVYFSLISATLLAIILWPHTPRAILIGWIGILLIASVLRVILFAAYRRAAPQGVERGRWGLPYLLTLLFSASVWGIGGVWIIPPDSMLHATVIFYFLMGMAGGAISAYSAIRPYALATILVVLLPMTAWMLAQGGITPVVMGVAAFLLVISAVRTSKVLSDTLQQNYLLTHELQDSKSAAERMARTDALTGLNNRRAFIELAEASISFCERHGYPVSAIVMDIDHFKRINDTLGHSVGDQALRHIAHILETSVRKSDICARAGGEEFTVLLPDTTLEAAVTVAEKVRTAIANEPFQTASGTIPLTASFGVATDTPDLESLLHLADGAMYQAKQAGRNRVVSHEDPDPQSELF